MKKYIYLITKLILAVLVIITTISCDWPMFLHDINHSNYVEESTPDSPYLIWTYDTRSEIYSSSAIKNNKIFISNSVGIFCIDINDGTTIWKTSHPVKYSSMAISEEGIIVGSYDRILSLDVRNGNVLWEFLFSKRFSTKIDIRRELFRDYIISSPIIFRGKIYIGIGIPNMYNIDPQPSIYKEFYVLCLNEETGKEEWNFYTRDNVNTSPATDGKYLFISSDSLYSIDITNVRLKWKYSKEIGRFISSPLIINGKVIASFSGIEKEKIIAIDQFNGEEIWKYKIDGNSFSSAGTG